MATLIFARRIFLVELLKYYVFFSSAALCNWYFNLRSLNHILIQEDAHVANAKFNSNVNEALFGVFDGHGGREVAVFSNKHYEEILNKDIK